jgi:hypothetical protein
MTDMNVLEIINIDTYYGIGETKKIITPEIAEKNHRIIKTLLWIKNNSKEWKHEKVTCENKNGEMTEYEGTYLEFKGRLPYNMCCDLDNLSMIFTGKKYGSPSYVVYIYTNEGKKETKISIQSGDTRSTENYYTIYTSINEVC